MEISFYLLSKHLASQNTSLNAENIVGGGGGGGGWWTEKRQLDPSSPLYLVGPSHCIITVDCLHSVQCQCGCVTEIGRLAVFGGKPVLEKRDQLSICSRYAYITCKEDRQSENEHVLHVFISRSVDQHHEPYSVYRHGLSIAVTLLLLNYAQTVLNFLIPKKN